MKQSKAELEKIAKDAGLKLSRMRDAERVEENRPLVGKTFRYRNSGGSAKWWLYAKVVGLAKDGMLQIMTFETQKSGDIAIAATRHMYTMATYGYVPCQRRTFQREWRALQKRIARMKP